jgi:hypothetical protein
LARIKELETQYGVSFAPAGLAAPVVAPEDEEVLTDA